jgi:hypothetical protein
VLCAVRAGKPLTLKGETASILKQAATGQGPTTSFREERIISKRGHELTAECNLHVTSDEDENFRSRRV